MSDTSFESVTKDLSDDFSALKKDMATLTSVVGDLARSQASAAKSNVYGLVDRARETYSDKAGLVSDRATDVSKKVRDASGDLSGSVQQNPLTALSLAFLSGLIIGMISSPKG